MQKFEYHPEYRCVELVPCLADGTPIDMNIPEGDNLNLCAVSNIVNVLTGAIYHDPEAAIRSGFRYPSGRTSKDIYDAIASKVLDLHKKLRSTNPDDIPDFNKDNSLPCLTSCPSGRTSRDICNALASIVLDLHDKVRSTNPGDIPDFDKDNSLPWLTQYLAFHSEANFIHELVAAVVTFPDIPAIDNIDDDDKSEEEVNAVLGLYARQFCRYPADMDNQLKVKMLESAFFSMVYDLTSWSGQSDPGKKAAKAKPLASALEMAVYFFQNLCEMVVEHDIDPTWVLVAITDAIESGAVDREVAELVNLFIFLLALYPDPDAKHAKRVRKLQKEKADIDDRTKSAIWNRVQELNNCLTAEVQEKFKVFDFLNPSPNPDMAEVEERSEVVDFSNPSPAPVGSTPATVKTRRRWLPKWL